jgi:hypothetical protein
VVEKFGGFGALHNQMRTCNLGVIKTAILFVAQIITLRLNKSNRIECITYAMFITIIPDHYRIFHAWIG